MTIKMILRRDPSINLLFIFPTKRPLSLPFKVMLDYDPKRRITLAEALRHKFIKPQYDKHLDNLRRFRPEYDYNKRSDRDRR